MVWLKTEGLSCEFGNDRMSLRFSADGKATSVVVDGRELLHSLSGAAGDPDREHSFYCDYHVGGKTKNLTPTRLEVIANTPELAHIAYVDDASPLKLSYHLVLAGQDTAVFGYVVAAVDEPGVEINELRTVYRFDSSLLCCGYTDERQGLQPRAEHMAAEGTWLQDETYRFADACRYTNSDVYSKYDYAGYFAKNALWGQWSGGRGNDEWGAWFIPLDKSCYPGGPLKQELLVHYDCIILNYMTGAHFGTGDFAVPEGWSKLYGPWCVYFNHGADVVADAHARACAEQQAGVAAWLEEPGLYASRLARITGALELASPAPCEGGWTVVASTEAGELAEQKVGRIYYAVCEPVAGAEGGLARRACAFELGRMQPGHYWLSASRNGSTDERTYELGEFDLTEGEELDLGLLGVANEQRELAWSIGTHTGTTVPFKFSDQLRNYVWMGLVPKNLTYEVGKDSPEDWYYLQRNDGVWRVRFAAPQLGAKRYLLTVCLAGTTAAAMVSGSSQVSFAVALNGRELASSEYENDRAAYRSSVTGGRPAVLTAEIDAASLAPENELAFTTSGYVFYDMIKLEAIEGESHE